MIWETPQISTPIMMARYRPTFTSPIQAPNIGIVYARNLKVREKVFEN
jgi:hypothetical protein